MNLLHLADLHLGRRLGEFDLLADQQAVCAQVLQLVQEQAVDAVLLAGDIYDKPIPSAAAVALLDDFLTQLQKTKVTVFLISGNHDSAERLSFGSRVLAAGGLYITGEFDGQMKDVVLSDAYGPVHIWSLPFVKASMVRHHLPDADTGTYDTALAAALETTAVNRTERNVLLAHQFVIAGTTEPVKSGSERETLSVGTIDHVEVSRFDAFDYVALGHIHGAQRVGRDTVRYAGSPLPYSLSEVNQRKSATLVHLGEKGDIQIELLPLHGLHALRHIKGPMAELLHPEHIEQPTDYMWVTLTDEIPILDAIGQIRSVYPNTIKLDYENSRSRAIFMAEQGAGHREKTFEELFCDFYRSVAGTEPSETEWNLVRTLWREGELI